MGKILFWPSSIPTILPFFNKKSVVSLLHFSFSEHSNPTNTILYHCTSNSLMVVQRSFVLLKILSTHSSALYTPRTLTQGRLTSRHIRRPNFQNHWPQSLLPTAQGTYQVTKSVGWIQRHTLRYNINRNLLQAYCRASINSALPTLQLQESFTLTSSLLSLPAAGLYISWLSCTKFTGTVELQLWWNLSAVQEV
jgi:hypothetical protein